MLCRGGNKALLHIPKASTSGLSSSSPLLSLPPRSCCVTKLRATGAAKDRKKKKKKGKTLHFQRDYFMQLPQIPAARVKKGGGEGAECRKKKKHTVRPSMAIKCADDPHNRTLHVQVGPLNERTPTPLQTHTPAPARPYLGSIYLTQNHLTHTHTPSHTHTSPQTPWLANIHTYPPQPHLLLLLLLLTGLCQAPWSPAGSVSLRTLDSDAPTRLRTAHNLGDLWPEPLPLPKKIKINKIK